MEVVERHFVVVVVVWLVVVGTRVGGEGGEMRERNANGRVK